MAAHDAAVVAAVALSSALVMVGPGARNVDASPTPAASCAPFAGAASATAEQLRSVRTSPVTLALRVSSDTVASGAPLTAFLVLQPIDGPVDLIVSRPTGARMITIVDAATRITIPTRPGYQELISMVRPERASSNCPLTIAVNVRAAYDLRPGTYQIRANFTPIVPRGLSGSLDVFPVLTSNDVVLTVTP